MSRVPPHHVTLLLNRLLFNRYANRQCGIAGAKGDAGNRRSLTVIAAAGYPDISRIGADAVGYVKRHPAQPMVGPMPLTATNRVACNLSDV